MANEDPMALDRPSPARMYDYFLHGDSNFPIDRAAGDAVMQSVGTTLTRDVVWENRRFLGRVVRHLAAECGIDQFIDLGCGLPSQENTHQVAQREIPGARVLYVDSDPAVEIVGRELAEDGSVGFVTADLRDPQAVLGHPATKELIDFDRPVAVMFIASLHFVRDEEDPDGIVAAFREHMVAGSYLAISHLCTADAPPAELAQMKNNYENATSPMVFRDLPAIQALFDGFTIADPGLVPVGLWNPGDDATESVRRMYGAVARKP